jgi:hypothetical protein
MVKNKMAAIAIQKPDKFVQLDYFIVKKISLCKKWSSLKKEPEIEW